MNRAIQDPLPWHEERVEIRDGSAFDVSGKKLNRIKIYGKSRQTVCEAAEFLYETTQESINSDWFYIGNIYDGVEGNVSYMPCTVTSTPGWSNSYQIQYSKNKKSTGIWGDAGNSSGYSNDAAFLGEKYARYWNFDADLVVDPLAKKTVTMTITRKKMPGGDYASLAKIVNGIQIISDGGVYEISQMLRSKGETADVLVIDFKNSKMYIEQYIDVTAEETSTQNIYEGYEILDSPVITVLPWIDMSIGSTVTVQCTVLTVDSENGNSTGAGDINLRTCMEYAARGIVDGIPPVRSGLLSVYDGYNNSGIYGRQRFERNWTDLMDNSRFSCGTFIGYTPLGYNSLNMRGNTQLSDLVQLLAGIEVFFAESDIDPDSTDTEEKYKETALVLDAHGALEVEEIEEEISKEDGTTEKATRKIYNCVPDGTHFPYAYIASQVPVTEGHCEILLPYSIDPAAGMTIQIISQLENSQDNFFLSTKHSWYETTGKMAMNPFDDYSLLIRNLNGSAQVYLNAQKALEGIAFSGSVTIQGSHPAYEAEGGLPFDLAVGFRKDLQKEANPHHYRGIRIYAVYIYNRWLSQEEIDQNMDYAGQRFGYNGRRRYFPKLEDGGTCTTLEEGLAYAGVKNADISELLQLIWEINLEHRLYMQRESEEYNTFALELMRAGKLKRPTAWDRRRAALVIDRGKSRRTEDNEVTENE